MSGPVVKNSEFSLGRLTNALGFFLRITQVQLNEQVRVECGVLPMPPGAMAVLQIIEANPGMRQVQLSRLLLIQESNLANLVKKFMAEGFIERRRDGSEKRGGLWLTEAGEAELARSECSETVNRRYASMLSDEEYDQLISLLDRVYRSSLGRLAPSPPHHASARLRARSKQT